MLETQVLNTDEIISIELTDAFKKLREAHLSAQDWQREATNFVPLEGSWFAQSEQSFDLDEEVNKFLFKEENKKILLLLGDSGAGKSLYTQGLASRLWQQSLSVQGTIPLWISLPALKKPVDNLIPEYLKQFGFTEAEIIRLQKNHSFTFILDAYDEIRTLKNLFVSNQLSQWQGRIIITCRREYLYSVDNYKLYFAPFKGEKAQYHECLEIIVRPFKANQIQKYLQQYVKNQETEWKDWERYEKEIEAIPGLKNLIGTPFMLKLAVEVLPKIVEQYQDVKKSNQYKQLTQAALYDVFIEQWFSRQEAKLKSAGLILETEEIKPEFWDYAKRLAQQMHAAGITQITYEESDESDLFGEVEAENPWKVFLNPENPRTALLLTACLVREINATQYAFIHDSLLEYFLTRELYKNLLEDKKEITIYHALPEENNFETKAVIPERKKQEDYFNQRLLVKEHNTIQFLADRINEQASFRDALFQQIYDSKNNPIMNVAAANSITILNQARVSFSGLDFSGIQIPEANLEYAILDHTNLSEANLTNVRLAHAWLRQADLSGSQLDSLQLSELPFFLHTGSNLMGAVQSKNGQYLAVVSGFGGRNVCLWDIQNGIQLANFTEHQGDINYLQFSHDGYWLASGGNDNQICIWNIEKRELHKCLPSMWVTDLLFDITDSYLISSDNSRQIIMWNFKTGELIQKLLTDLTDASMCVKLWVTMDNKLLGMSGVGFIQSWDLATKQKLASVVGSPFMLTKFIGAQYTQKNGEFTIAVAALDNSIHIKCLYQSKQQTVMPTPLQISGIENLGNPFGFLSSLLQDNLFTKKFFDMEEFTLIGYTSPITQMAFSSDGKILASVSQDHSIYFWDIQQRNLLRILPTDNETVTAIAFNKQGTFFAAAITNRIQLWNSDDWCLQRSYYGHTAAILQLEFNQEGNTLFSVSQDKTVRRWQVLENTALKMAYSQTTAIQQLEYNSDTQQLISYDSEKKICLWNIVTGELWNKYRVSGSYVMEKLSSDGRFLYVVDQKGEVGYFTTRTGQWQSLCISVVGKIQHLIFAEKEKKLAILSSVDGKQTLQIWDIDTSKSLRCFTNIPNKVTQFLWLSSDAWMTGNERGIIQYWGLTQESQKLISDSENEEIITLASSIDQSYLAFASRKNIRLRHLFSHQEWLLQNRITHIEKIFFSPDSRYLALHGRHNIAIYNNKDAKLIYYRNFFPKLISRLDWDRHSEQLVIAINADIEDRTRNDYTHEILIWESISYQLTTITTLLSPITQLQFLSDEALLVASKEGSIKLWKPIKSVIYRKEWQLNWNSHLAYLLTTDLNIRYGQNLTLVNKELLCQRGAHENNNWTLAHIAAAKGEIDVLATITEREIQAGPQALTPLHVAVLFNQENVIDFLLTHSVQIDLVNSSLQTATHLAAMHGRQTIMQKLILAQANLNLRDKQGKTPLHFAAFGGFPDMVRSLVNSCAPLLEVSDTEELTALHIAVLAEHEKVVTILLSLGANIEAESCGRTALMMAAARGSTFIAKTLLAHGAKLTASTQLVLGFPAIHVATMNGYADVVKLLVDAGAPLNDLYQMNWSLLHTAVFKGQKEVVKVLLSYENLEIDIKNKNGETPFFLAVKNGSLKLAELLFEKMAPELRKIAIQEAVFFLFEDSQVPIVNFLALHDADFNKQDVEGNTVLHCLLMKKTGKQEQLLRALVEQGAQLEIRNQKGETPLIKAVIYGDAIIVDVLLELGADSKVKAGNNDYTLLHRAVILKHEHIVAVLLKRGVDLAGKDCDEKTALHYAAQHGLARTASLLLNENVNVNECDKGNSTPLHLAALNGHISVVKLIIAAKNTHLEMINDLCGTPLSCAATSGHADVVGILLDHGVNPNTQIKSQNSLPLFLAMISKKEHAIVQLLLEHQVEKNIKGPLGLNALIAATACDEKMVDLLLSYHCPLDEPDDLHQRTALYNALRNNNKPIISRLLKAGGNVNFLEKNGGNAMHIAASVGDTEVINLLIEYKVNLKQKDNRGWTCVHAAASVDRINALEILCTQADIDLNAQDYRGNTATHLLVANNYHHSLEILLKYKNKLDLNSLNKEELTAIQVAAQKEHSKIVELLMQQDSLKPCYKIMAQEILSTSKSGGKQDIPKTSMTETVLSPLLLPSQFSQNQQAINSVPTFQQKFQNTMKILQLQMKIVGLALNAQFTEVQQLADEILSIESDNPEGLVHKTISLFNLGFFQEACIYCNKVLDLEEKYRNNVVLRYKGAIYFHLDKFEDATIYLEEYRKLMPDAKYSICYQGYIAILSKNLDLATSYFDDVLVKSATCGGALLGKGLIDLIQGKQGTAQGFFLQAQKSTCNLSEELEFYYVHGKVLTKFGFIEEARAAFEKALLLKADYAPVLNEMKNLPLLLKNNPKINIEQKDIKTKSEDNIALVDNSLNTKTINRQVTDSKQQFIVGEPENTKQPEKISENPVVFFTQEKLLPPVSGGAGGILNILTDMQSVMMSIQHNLRFGEAARAGNYKEALICVQKMLALQPNDIHALYKQSSLMLALAQYQEAIEVCDKIQQLDNLYENGIYYTVRGTALLLLNRLEEASTNFDENIKLNNQAKCSPCYKGCILLLQKNFTMADELFTTVLLRDKNCVAALLGKGLLAFMQGQIELAQEFFQKIDSEEMLYAKLEARLIQGKMLLLLGFPKEAHVAFENALLLKSDYVPVLNELKLMCDKPHTTENSILKGIPENFHRGHAEQNVQNSAVTLFLDEKALDFQSWYHPESCHYLLQMAENKSKCIRVMFHDANEGNNTQTFKNQLLQLVMLSHWLKRPALFISKEPGADNHFICGLVKEGNLLLINPLGMTEQETCYQTLAELKREKTLKAIWISSNPLQKRLYEAEGLVSCGPITLELATHILTHFTPKEWDIFWENHLKTDGYTTHDASGLTYYGMNIETLLPETLKALIKATNKSSYENQVCGIRQKHCRELQALPVEHAKNLNTTVEDYLSNCKEGGPHQLTFNALITEKTLNTIDELPVYQLLKQELDSQPTKSIPQKTETKSNKILSQKNIFMAENDPKSEKIGSEVSLKNLKNEPLFHPYTVQANALVFMENQSNCGRLANRQISKYAFCFFDTRTLRSVSCTSKNSYIVCREIEKERGENESSLGERNSFVCF